jgi:hypothetical protein
MQQLQELKDYLSNKDWFYDLGFDSFNRPVVYVHYMNLSVFSEVRKYASEALIYYASYAKCNKLNYVEQLNPEPDLEYLESKVKDLQSIYKLDLLQDMFYEIHDGENAVTSFSKALPELKSTLEDLYEKYGYDLLYERLEG